MSELLVEVHGRKVCHIVRVLKGGDWWKYGTTLCGLPFYESEIVNESDRPLCATCKRIGDKAIAAEVAAEHAIDEAHDRLEELQQ